MPEDLKLSQISSFQLPPPFRGLHSPGVRKHCQIVFACYFRKLSIRFWRPISSNGPQVSSGGGGGVSSNWPEFSLTKMGFTSVKFKVVSMRWEKPIICAPPRLRSFLNIAFETVPMFVWLMMALSCPFKEDRLMMALSCPFKEDSLALPLWPKMMKQLQFSW